MAQGRQALYLAACGIAFFSTAYAFAAAPPGTSLSGSLSTSASGAATYQLPILSPPGIISPSLSLQYSSQGGNGPVGVGWSLGGLSQLSRCPRTKVVDGINDGALQFNSNDRLCLDGQRLILKSGTYGANNAVYGTQIDTDLQVVGKGSFASGSAWFEVRSKDGQVMEYGRTSNSRRAITLAGQSGAIPITWALNKVSDRFSNYYTVSYLLDSGILYPSVISYAGNTNAGTPASRTVTLDWGVAAPRPDPIPVYVGGGVSAQIRYRLTRVTNNATAARYLLSYGSSDAQLSQLNKIEYCPESGTSTCLTLEGEYGSVVNEQTGDRTSAPAVVLADYGKNQGWQSQDVHPRELGDINGDGRLDIVGFKGDGVYVALGSEDGFLAPVRYSTHFDTDSHWSSNTVFPRMVVDINGDGMSDVIGFAAEGLRVSLSNGAGLDTQTLWVSGFGRGGGWSDQVSRPRMLGDVNGDGMLDVIGFAVSYVKVALNRQTHLEVSSDFPDFTSDFHQNAGWSNNDKFPRTMIDVNGDGKDDIVGFGPTGVKVSLSTGSSFAPAELWLADFFPTSETYTENFEMTYGTYTFEIPYTLTRKRWQAQSRSPRYLYDVDGDGLPDIVALSWEADISANAVFKYRPDMTIYVAKNTGTGFLPPVIVQPGGDFIVEGPSDTKTVASEAQLNTAAEKRVSTYNLADINGDGRGDIVHMAGDCTSFRPSLGLTLGPSQCLADGFTEANGGWTDKDDRLFVDIDGDGALDMLGYNATGVVVSYGQSQFPDQIHTFTSDLGEARVEYGTLVDDALYVKGSGSVFPVTEIQSPMPVVAALHQDDGLGAENTTQYRYGGLRSHLDYGSLGFQWVESRHDVNNGGYPDPIISEINYSEYLQTFPLTGSLYRTQRRHCYPGIPYSGQDRQCTVTKQEVSTWDVQASGSTTDRKIYRPYISTTTEKTWDPSSNPAYFGYGHTPAN